MRFKFISFMLRHENIVPVARLDFPLFARFFAVGLERAAQTCVAGQKVRVKFGPYAQYLLSVGILFDLQPLIAFGHGLVGVGIAVRRFSAAARQRASTRSAVSKNTIVFFIQFSLSKKGRARRRLTLRQEGPRAVLFRLCKLFGKFLFRRLVVCVHRVEIILAGNAHFRNVVL